MMPINNKAKDGNMLCKSHEAIHQYISVHYGDKAAQEFLTGKKLV